MPKYEETRNGFNRLLEERGIHNKSDVARAIDVSPEQLYGFARTATGLSLKKRKALVAYLSTIAPCTLADLYDPEPRGAVATRETEEDAELERLRQRCRELPAEARAEVTDFVDFLAQRYDKHRMRQPESALPLEAEPFIGMWKDRPEMEDSTEWVRETRRRGWGPRHG